MLKIEKKIHLLKSLIYVQVSPHESFIIFHLLIAVWMMIQTILRRNGATLRKIDYLKSIGITHILNAAESRGVNVGSEYFGPDFEYMGLKVEDTPQTQICK